MSSFDRPKSRPDSLASIIFPVADALPEEEAIAFIQAYQRYRGLEQAGGPEEEWTPPESSPYAEVQEWAEETLVGPSWATREELMDHTAKLLAALTLIHDGMNYSSFLAEEESVKSTRRFWGAMVLAFLSLLVTIGSLMPASGPLSSP